MPEMDLRQIDALVAEKVMEWNVQTADSVREVYVWPNTLRTTYVHKGERFVVHQDGTALTVPPYSSDIAAAMQVWHALRAQGVYLDIETYADFFAVTARHESGIELAYKDDPSLSKAICEVALLVNGVEVPEDA